MLGIEHGYIYDLLVKLGLSDFGARTGEFLLVRPLKVVLILVLALVLARLSGRAIKRFVRSVQSRSPLLSSARAEQRAQTLGDVLASGARALIMTDAVLMVLGQIGLNLAPLIAGAGIAGVAIGFGAQSLVRDFLSGFFIIVEDQYGVGDLIDLGSGTVGTVEELSMRVTRVRSVDGSVWFVPNGEIRKVGNSSMEWSRAVVDILVSYNNDVDQVIALVKDEAERFASDPQWADDVLEQPDVWGVQSTVVEGFNVRAVVRTAPRQQFIVARALRGRLLARLHAEGVKLPGQS
jgi:small conductance mechanosensitive channel